MKFLSGFIIIFLFTGWFDLFAQNVPADNPIYKYLKQMSIRNIIPEYDDFVIPMERAQVDSFLYKIKNREGELTNTERELLNKYCEKFGLLQKPLSLFSDFYQNLSSSRLKYFIYYEDSILDLTINPIIGIKFIDLSEPASSGIKNALLGRVGANLYGTFNKSIGFYLEASNEAVWGAREAAEKDPQVAQSFTFNKTKINYIDYTGGYIQFQSQYITIQLGRERILWGNGYEHRMVLSSNPPPFDFIKFNFTYKTLNYKFIHGWLVQPTTSVQIDSLTSIKNKEPKYIALSRLGFNPSSNIKLGVSQIVIYSNRPLEAAYLNPFLFWESAQRSMNDLDNSFLSFDIRTLLIGGLELNGSILLDDIHFGRLFSEGWNDISNRNAWNAGIFLTNPILPKDLSFNFDYIQIRPFMFSHPGVGEMLTYTNNGYLLGAPFEPNSSNYCLSLDYNFSSFISAYVKYNYTLHGDNIRDPNGKVIENVGGNIYEYYTYYDDKETKLLEGNLEKSYFLNMNLGIEPWYYIFFNLGYTHIKGKKTENVFNLSINYSVF